VADRRNNLLDTKTGDSKEVRDYRPITCLTTMYKTLTRKIAKRISTNLEELSLQQQQQQQEEEEEEEEEELN